MLGVRPLLQDLSPTIRAKLTRVGQVKSFDDGQLIFARGHDSPSFCIVERGRIRFSNMSLEGRRTGSGVMEPGDSFGEFTVFADSPRFFDFYALGDVRLRIISRAQFKFLMAESAELSNAIIRLLSMRLLLTLEMLEDLRHLPLDIRLCKFLYRGLGNSADGRTIEASQEAIAEDLAVSRVALAKVIRELRTKKLIRTRYRRIEVLDAPALATIVKQGAQLTGITRK